MKITWKGLLKALHTFGGLVIFQLVLWKWGAKPAIAASLAYLLIDGAWRLARREKLPPVWLLSNGLALAFGIIDLTARTPFMLKYEGTVSNGIVGLIFVAGARGERPMIMQLAEQSLGRPFPEKPGLVAYFRAFTLAWAAYSFAKAGLSLWLVSTYPLVKAFALRSLIGTVSLVVMLAISFSGKRVFALCQKLGLFRGGPTPSAEPAP